MRRGGMLAAAVVMASAALFAMGLDAKAPAEAGAALVGRKATVEYRPVSKGPTETIQKQRIGTLTRVSADWVGINDENDQIEVWVPREMVLEIRLGK